MKRFATSAVPAVLLAAATFAAPRLAHACSCFVDPIVVPAAGSSLPRDGAIFLGGWRTAGNPDGLRLVRLDDESSVSFTRDEIGAPAGGRAALWILRPAEDLLPGERYELRHDDEPQGPPITEFDVVAERTEVIGPPSVVPAGGHSSPPLTELFSTCSPSVFRDLELSPPGAVHTVFLGTAEPPLPTTGGVPAESIGAGRLARVGRQPCWANAPDAFPLGYVDVRVGTWDEAGNFTGWSSPTGLLFAPPGCTCQSSGTAHAVWPGILVLVVLVFTRRQRPVPNTRCN